MSRLKRTSQLIETLAWQLQQLRGPKASTKKLPVVLLKDVPGVGTSGELAKVNFGFARNFLIPSKLASQRLAVEQATSGSTAASSSFKRGEVDEAYEEERAKREAARKRKQFEGVIKKLTTVPILIRRKTKEDGKLLEQPVTAEDVAHSVARQLQISIVPELVDMGKDVLTAVGEYRLPLKLTLPGGERGNVDVTVTST